MKSTTIRDGVAAVGRSTGRLSDILFVRKEPSDTSFCFLEPKKNNDDIMTTFSIAKTLYHRIHKQPTAS